MSTILILHKKDYIFNGEKSMPPRIKTTKETIINTAYEIVREDGWKKLTARNLAQKLGTSVQPIFRAFANMEELEEVVMEKIKDKYREYIMSAVSIEDALMGTVMAYIRFAREEKQLFQILHMSDRYAFAKAQEVSSVDINVEIVKVMALMENITMEEAGLLYQATFFTTHGIASMVATNHCDFSDEEIKRMLENVFDGLSMKIKSEKMS